MKENYQWFAFPVVLVGAMLVCVLIYTNVLRYQFPPRWDEAQHMLFAWQVWDDFMNGNIVKFLKDSHAQFYWPFLHSWWVAGFMTLFGVTDFGARMSSLAAMAISVFLMFYAGWELDARRGMWTGMLAVAAFLMFASFPAFAAQCMIELPAMMMSLVALLMYVRAEKNRTRKSYLGFGCALGATFLMRYDFGLALISAFAVVAITELLFSREESYLRNVIQVLVPLVVVFLFWFIVPEYRLNKVFEVLINRPQGPQELGWAYVMYYPKVIYADVGWWALLFIGALVNSLRHLKDRVIRLLFSVCIIYFGVIFFHQTRGPRHIYPLYPALILLMAFEVVSQAAMLLKDYPRARAVLLSVIIAGMFIRPATALSIPRRPVKYERIPAEIASYVYGEVKNSKSLFVIGEFNYVPAHLIAWELRKRGSREPVYQSMDHKRELEGISALTPGGKDTADLSKLEQLLNNLSVDTVITVDLKKTSPFYDEGYSAFNSWEQKYVDRFALVSGYSKAASRDFASAGLSVTVYRRQP